MVFGPAVVSKTSPWGDGAAEFPLGAAAESPAAVAAVKTGASVAIEKNKVQRVCVSDTFSITY